MRMNAVCCCLLLWVVACLGQNPSALFEKAPPEIDEALRARITKFYQLHVEGKFRAADAFVAEDSKDAFFGAQKSRCNAFEIATIKYSDNFSRALAVIQCDTEMTLPIAPPMPVKIPVSSLWKVVDGQWFWYIEPVSDKGVVTPFGISRPQSAQQPAGPAGLPMAPMDLQTMSGLVKADKREVNFDPSIPGVERVVVTNQMPGSVSLSLEPERLEGLDLKLDPVGLTQGGSAVLLIRYQPAPDRKPSPATVRIVVSPIEQVIPIQIRFGAPSPAPHAN